MHGAWLRQTSTWVPHLRRCEMIQSILQVVVLLLRAGLAAVLVAAGSAKLADLRSFALTLLGLGLPARWRLLLRGLGLIIPLFEVCVGRAIVRGLLPTV